MQDIPATPQITDEEAHLYASNLLMAGQNPQQVINALIVRGYSTEQATNMVLPTAQNIYREKMREAGKKEMLYGALWLAGGLILTFANIGYIFYGAIIVGIIKIVRGYTKTNT